MKKINGILKLFRIESETIEVKEINLFNCYPELKPITSKFVEKINYFIEIVNLEDYYIYTIKIDKDLYEKFRNLMKEINKECNEDEKIVNTLILEVKYTEDENGDLVLKDYQIKGQGEILKYIK